MAMKQLVECSAVDKRDPAMINNDVLRRLRFALNLSDTKVIAIFAQVNRVVSESQIALFMTKEDEPEFQFCPNDVLMAFLDGLIVEKRGKQEGKEPEPWPVGQPLSNNDILRKIRIALKLTDKDMIALMAKVDFRVSPSELSALFRKPDHRNYKECGNQFLRNFLTGLTAEYRPEAANKNTAKKAKPSASKPKPKKIAQSEGKRPDKPKNVTFHRAKKNNTDTSHNRPKLSLKKTDS